MSFIEIPDELKELRQWVCWQLVERDGKMTKIPVQTTGQPASSTDPTTWCSFDQACGASKRFSGIGFVFSKEAGYTGIDLDKCRDPQTRTTEPWAEAILTELGSYRETSQSGTGWHVIVRATLPEGRKRAGRVEMYDHGRFFVMTGENTPFVPIIEAVDLSALQQRITTLDPAPPTKANTAATVDESSEDFKLIGDLQRTAKCKDADALEDAFRKAHPKRYDERNAEKGSRAGKSYFRYTIENFLQKNPPKPPVVIASDTDSTVLDMPPDVLDGRLGEMCEKNLVAAGLPRSYSWTALLAVGSLLIPNGDPTSSNRELARTAVFVSPLGPTFSGKNTAIEFAMKMLGINTEGSSVTRANYGSGEGLQKGIGDRNGAPVLWYQEELSHTMKKTRIDGASMPEVLCQLYSSNRRSYIVRKEDATFDARLSIAGGLVDTKFDEAFGEESVGGLYDRFLFGLHPTGHQFLYRTYAGEVLRTTVEEDDDGLASVPDLNLNPVYVDRSVYDSRDAYVTKHRQAGQPVNGRVIESCIRAAAIAASYDGRNVLLGDHLAPAWALADYQHAVREILAPASGHTFDATIADKVLRYLDRIPAEVWVEQRTVVNGTHVSKKFGPRLCAGTLDALVKDGSIEQRLGEKPKRGPTPKLIRRAVRETFNS